MFWMFYSVLKPKKHNCSVWRRYNERINHTLHLCDSSTAPLVRCYTVSRHSSQPQTTPWDLRWAEGRLANYLNTNSLVHRRHRNPLFLHQQRITQHIRAWCQHEICMIQQQDMLFRSSVNSVHSLWTYCFKYEHILYVHILYQHAAQSACTKALFQIKQDHYIN